jgi:hypothetical protein
MVTMFVEGQGYVTVTERQAAALERAAKARGEAMERERQRQLKVRIGMIQELAEQTSQFIDAAKSSLPADKAVLYEQEVARLGAIAANSQDAGSLYGAELALLSIRQRIENATAAAQAQAEAAAGEGEFDAELAAFDQRLNSLRAEGAAEQDAPGRAAAVQAVNACRSLLKIPNLEHRRAAHRDARLALEAHAAAFHAAQAQQAAARQQAQQQLEAAQQIVAGLASDDLVQRWAPARAAELQERVAGWSAAIAAGNLAAVDAAQLAELQSAAQALLDQVGAAQFKAEQRDYILQSVREVLAEMGFMLSPAEAETPGHPASAMRFSAVNAAGQSMDVSVPLEGEVWYDVDGFPRSTEAKVGGGSAAVCDSAQRVIEEMHHEIEEQFGIKSGELTWEGKDPDRILRQMDELPSSGSADRYGEER